MVSSPDAAAPRLRLPKVRRVAHRRDFDRIFALKASVSDSRLIVYAAPNDLTFSRVGVIATTKLGGAVVRNRCKRLMREAFRLNQTALPAGYDFLMLARSGGPFTLDQYIESLLKLAERAVKKCDRA